MSKLWLVELKVMAVVVADDADSAEGVARDEARRIVDDSDIHDFVASTQSEVTSPNFKCGGWDKMCIPYGDDSDDRIGERLLPQNSGEQ